MLAGAWGVKEEVNLDQVEGLKNYITTIEGTQIELDDGKTAKILKADIKERKGENILIFRYQLQP
ncbi:MAG: hypothetical protein PHS13_05785 [Firmicutes bacterium]|nr:hypothetical protein [Bacillota bacterium]MDD4707580.1 hypothetical protein [Bacillota bacterium]